MMDETQTALPHAKTYEEVLSYTSAAAHFVDDDTVDSETRSGGGHRDSVNASDKRTTRIVAIVGIGLLVLSIILIGVTLSLSDYIDRLVREKHKGLSNSGADSSSTNVPKWTNKTGGIS